MTSGHLKQVHPPSTVPVADARQGVYHVFIRDLETRCSIGVHGHEKGAAQRVRINLDLGVGESAEPLNDDIANVVCYEDVVKGVLEIAGGVHVNLVETLAEKIAAHCLEDARVKSARVRIEKLDAFEEAASVGIEIERLRT
ncbi:MAG: dihydroneopterin aldolase [Rhodospirillales bacterium]